MTEPLPYLRPQKIVVGNVILVLQYQVLFCTWAMGFVRRVATFSFLKKHFLGAV